VPGVGYDKKTYDPKQTIEVVGAGLRGYTDAIRAGDKNTNPVKLLVTGFGKFSQDASKGNPTEDFVSNPDNLHKSMKAAFGEGVEPEKGADGKAILFKTPGGDPYYQYKVKDANGKEFSVQVMAATLEVKENGQNTDVSVAGGKGSFQDLMKKSDGDFSPHGVIAMGVDYQATEFKVVVRSDTGGADVENNNGVTGLKHNSNKTTPKDPNGIRPEIHDNEIVNDELGTAIFGGKARHTIKEGETLSSIAKKFGTTVEALVELNRIDPSKHIYPGAVLTLPPGKLPAGTERPNYKPENLPPVTGKPANLSVNTGALKP
jgi:LysM repeat protein